MYHEKLAWPEGKPIKKFKFSTQWSQQNLWLGQHNVGGGVLIAFSAKLNVCYEYLIPLFFLLDRKFADKEKKEDPAIYPLESLDSVF